MRLGFVLALYLGNVCRRKAVRSCTDACHVRLQRGCAGHHRQPKDGGRCEVELSGVVGPSPEAGRSCRPGLCDQGVQSTAMLCLFEHSAMMMLVSGVAPLDVFSTWPACLHASAVAGHMTTACLGHCPEDWEGPWQSQPLEMEGSTPGLALATVAYVHDVA